jgi:hypothetical protein
VTTSQIGTAIDTLVEFFTAALPGVTIYDGSTASMEYPADWLVVGGDGSIDEEETAATSKQRWAGLGAQTKDEDVLVTCAVGASSGVADAQGFKPVRVRALVTLGAAEQALRDDPSLGDITQGGAEMSDAELRYSGGAAGLSAVLVFTVLVPMRLERS